MLNTGLVAAAAFGYLFLLFAIAYYGDWQRARGKSIIANPYIYALSLAAYCTAWTFFGSVGKAATSGVTFLTIYLGPTIIAFSWWFGLRKLLRICKENNLTTMSDFLTLRYGKGAFLGMLATVGVLFAITPYISLQLKSISDTISILVHKEITPPLAIPIYQDTAFYVALLLVMFGILFGARHLDPTERHEGLVAVVVFESLIELLAFFSLGILVTFSLFPGWGEIFTRIQQSPEFQQLLLVNTGPQNSYSLLLVLTLLAMGAIHFLPRMFHMAVVENTEERHILTAIWLFPLYLLLINLFVLPIAFGGLLLGLPPEQGDTFVLRIPLQTGHPYLALLVFLGGLSASTAMVAVASIAVSTMLVNSLVMPLAIRLRLQERITPHLLTIKRGAILLLILLGYFGYHLIFPTVMLVDIGLIAFCGVMQLVPAMLGALYWREATRWGAISGLMSGFFLWAYTLVLPYLVEAGWFPQSILNAGPFGLAILNPTAFLGLTGLDKLSHAFFWSLLVNAGAFVSVSLLTVPNPVEEEQSRRFVEVFEQERELPLEKRYTYFPSLDHLTSFMEKLIGPRKAAEAQRAFLQEVAISESEWGDREKLRLAGFIERTIAGSIGPAAARVIVEGYFSSVGSRMEDVFDLFGRISSSLEESEQQLKRRVAELSVLYEAAHRLASSLYIPDLLEGVLGVLGEQLGVEKCAVRLLDEEGFLHIRGLRGLPSQAREMVVKPDPESLLGQCLHTSQVISVADSSEVADRLRGLMKEETLGSAVLAPITTETLTLGVLTAASSQKGFFTREHVELFQSLAGQLGLAVRTANMEEALRLDESRLEAVWQISQMTKAALKEITDFALEEGVRLTKSTIGYLAFMNEEETVLTMQAWSKTAMEECAITDKPFIYPLETTGLWGEAVRQRRPIITNDYAAPNPYKKGYPAGHVEIRRHLNIPVFDGARIVAVAGVGNKDEDYDESDVRQLTLLMNGMWSQIKRQRAEEELTAEVERGIYFQHLLIDTCMDGIVAHDMEGVIRTFNDTAARILGYEPKEVMGKVNVKEIYAPGQLQEINTKIRDSFYGGEGILENYETWMRHKDGALVPIWLSARVLKENDREIGMIGHFKDLRERKRMEDELLRSERLAILGKMAAHISHEIKNPLMLIGGFARQVLKDIAQDPQKNLGKLQIIVDEVRRLEDFLVEVGSYAKFSEPQKTMGNLNALIQETCQRLEPSLRESNIELVLELDPNLPEMQFDPAHLRQVILNIAKNGIEAMETRGTLTITTGRRIGRIFIEICDTGVGIPPEVQEKIFQPFFSSKPKGSGLGLAISQKIIQAHQGEIVIDSEPHKGTRVTVYLPESNTPGQQQSPSENAADNPLGHGDLQKNP
ncbi:MAG: GAF domain-containing protein [Deltaproteobacteria bacterium]|nr:GAF domain-containing protein [Deltaproteobacteria bacterium]